MKWLRNGSAIIIWLILGVIGFMAYHKQTTLPLADVMSTQTSGIEWDISYQITSNQVIITNASTTLLGTLSITIAYDPQSVQLPTDQLQTPYEYSFDKSRAWSLTLFINGTIKKGKIITIPVVGDTNNISISSPNLITWEGKSSLSITRIE